MPLENEDIKRLKEIFVTKEDCRENVIDEDEKIADLRSVIVDLREETRVERMKLSTKMNIMIAILAAIGTSIISLCVSLLFGG